MTLWLLLFIQGPAPATPAVTRSEAAAIFAKAERVMRQVIGSKKTLPPFAEGKEVAARDALVKQFGLLCAEAAPKFKFVLPAMRYDPSIVTLKTATGRQVAARLCALGLLDKVGPLVASKSEGITPEEFGDTLGYFLARIAELTHTPSQKFSPALMPP